MTDVLGAAPQTPMTQWNEIRQNTYLPRSEDMPRTKSAATIDSTAVDAATLERQMLADSSIKPDYTPEPTPFDEFDAEPSRDERIAALDARDDALNGVSQSELCGVRSPMGFTCTSVAHDLGEQHSWQTLSAEQMYPAEGVRPSERCGFRSNLGISCTEREGHASPHSWQESTDGVGHTYTDLDQAELPGTPEPTAKEPTDYDIPWESQFNDKDYQESAGLRAIAERHIAATEEFAHLRGVKIAYFWKRRGGLKGGKERLSALMKPGGLAAFACGNPTFVLWLAADHCLLAKLTDEQLEALVFDRLCQAVRDPEDHSAYRVVAPDFEGNILTIQRYGFIFPDLREMGANVKQMNLLDGLDIDAADVDDDQDDSEGDDGEGEGGE